MKLSSRLQLIADVIKEYKQGSKLADIGTDHAYLPCYLVQNNIITHAYACDVAKGPFTSSQETIASYELEEQVTALLGDGLEPVLNKKVDMISIAGMGAYLVTEILEKHRVYLQNIKVMFLQVNANTDHLRKYLFSNDWKIIDEKMVKDAGHIYEVLVVTKQHNKDIMYSKNDIEFGPVLTTTRPMLFKEKWEKQSKVYHNIMDSLPENHPRYIELHDKVQRIEGLLHESK
ncbi:MAG: tRNA (adenine(22)-N(1))-methyltransferase [Coprobacillaceae bacterium]